MHSQIPLLAAAAVVLLTFAPGARAADVPHVTGGIGYEGREEMKAAERDHNLKVIAAEKNTGDFLTEVKVVIESAKKEQMLSTTMEGPILLAKLPPGTYTVKATFDGDTQAKTVSVGSGLRSVDFRWATVEGKGETALPRPPAQPR